MDRSAIKYLLDFYKKLSQEISHTLDEQKLPIIVGGDHSIAVSTWSTLVDRLDAYDDFGLIWVDAHLDAHTYETSPSKAFHGMPVAHLLGYGEPEFSGFLNPKRKINPKYLVYIGVRSFEREEKELMDKLNVRIISIKELKKRGFAECFREALTIVSQASKGFGVSIDIDFFDPLLAPGVGSPAGGGANPIDILPILSDLKSHPNLRAIEIVEFNPAQDKNNITKDLCLKLISANAYNYQ